MNRNPRLVVTLAGALAVAAGLAMAQPGPMMGGPGGGMFQPVPAPPDNPTTPQKVALGKQLYFDARLSRDGTISCASCHAGALGGADGRPVSIGVGGAVGQRNAPTVWNAAFHQAQFWDGRARSLEEQAKGPLVNPLEMAMPDFAAVVARVAAVPGYVTQFRDVFGAEGVTIDTIAKSIAAYERTLISTGSRFDAFRFLDRGALTPAELDGFDLFRMAGCTQCHMGPDLAGPPPLARGPGFYQRFPRFADNALVAAYRLLEDGGRWRATGLASDRHVYRVPSLRNVARTAPYFHNGSAATLAEAVRVCAKGGSNIDLDAAETAAIVAFLGALDGEPPDMTPPPLP